MSPANGKIISIISTDSESIDIYKDNKKALQLFTKSMNLPVTIVSIMLTLSDVHYQRACYDSKIIEQSYHR